MRILGIDPGLRSTGFGVVSVADNFANYITSGVIVTDAKQSLAVRLKTIISGISEIIEMNQPDCVSIEKVFVNNNPHSTLLLGQARGAAIAACVIKQLAVFEYTALQIKKSVVGYGHAEKIQVAKMVELLLKLNGQPRADAADALAVALTHVQSAKIGGMFNISSIKQGRIISR